MNKLRFPLSSLIFWPIMVLSILLVNNFSFLNTETFPTIDNTTFSMLGLLVLGLIILYFVIEHKKNKLKPHFVLFPIFLVITILFVATIWIQEPQTFTSDSSNLSVICDIPTINKIKYSFEVVIMMSVLYGLFYFYSRKQVHPKSSLWLAYIVVLVAIFLLVYAVITEKDEIFAVFSKNTTSSESYKGLKSLFFNENAFAMYLTISLSSVLIINSHTKKWWSSLICYLIAFVIYAGIFFTTAVTAIIASTVVFISFIFYALGKLIKKKIVLGLIITILFSIILIGGIVVFSALYYSGTKWLVNLSDFIFENFFSKDFQTFTNRTAIWKHIWEDMLKVNPLYIAFGRGHGTGNQYLFSMAASISGKPFYYDNFQSAHSVVFEILYRFGFFGLGLYILGICFFVGCCIYLMVKKQGKIAIPYLIGVIGALIEGFAETNLLFNLDFMSVLQTVIFVLPVLNYTRTIKNPTIVKDFEENPAISTPIQRRKFATLVSSVLFGLSLCCFLYVSLSYILKEVSNVTYLFMLLGILFLTAAVFSGVTISNLLKVRNKFLKILLFVLYGVCVFGCALFGVLHGSKIYGENNKLMFLAVYLVSIFIPLVLWLVLSSIKKYAFKEWFVDTFVKGIKYSLLPTAISLIFGLGFAIVALSMGNLSNIFNIFCSLLSLIVYIVTMGVQRNKINLYLVHYYNEQLLAYDTKLLRN